MVIGLCLTDRTPRSLCGDPIHLLSHVFYCWLCIPDDAMAQQYNNIIPAHLHIYRHWAKINTTFVNGNNNSEEKVCEF